MKKTWYQQEQERIRLEKGQDAMHTQEHAHHEHPAAAAPPAAGTPAWLKDLIAILEAILGVIPTIEGHTIETEVRKDLTVKLERLKAGLPK